MKSNWKKLLSLALVLALMVGFAPGMGMTARADTALPADGSDAGNGLIYYVGYTMVQQGGNYQAAGDNSGGASLFDRNPATKACIGFEGSYSVEFSYASEITPHNYYFRTGDDTSTQTKRNPSAWKLEGKNTDNTWTVLDEKSEQTYTTDNNTEVRFGISNNTAYQTFRLTITANNSSGRDDWPIGGKPSFQLSEVYMSGTIAPAGSVASVTPNSGGTPTEYTTFSAALDAWADDATLTLLSDVTTSSTISVSGTKTLDLNGYGIRATGTGYSVITVGSGANLTLNDSRPTETTHYFTVENSAPNGAGLATNISTTGGNGRISFTGGYITGGNSTNTGGGGVQINGGTLNIYGGTIIGNTANTGGGVRAYSGGTVRMNGGSVRNNYATNRGGGVEISASDIEFNGGTVSYNRAGEGGGGIGVYDNNATICVTGGRVEYNISGTHAAKLGGGIDAGESNKNITFTMSGNPVVKNNLCSVDNSVNNCVTRRGTTIQIVGEMTGNAGDIGISLLQDDPRVFTSGNTTYIDSTKFVSDNSSYAVSQNSSGQLELRVPPAASVTSGGTTTEYTTFADALGAWANGSTLTLLDDVTTATTISVSGTKTLDLNGYGVLMKGEDRVISVQGNASLTLDDSNPGKSNYITLNDYRGTSVANSGVESFSNGNGVVKVDGGYLTGGIRSSGADGPTAGAGVLINQGGTFVLNGGTIVGNTITNSNSGSGVRNDKGIFTMNGGKITYNKAGRNGGGLTTTGENCTVHGGEISNNYAALSGGGVQAAGSFALTGGSIVNNASGNPGGGVCAGEVLTISGNVKITGNTASGKADNLYLASNNLTVSGNLADGAQVGVNMQTPGVFTNSTDTAFNDASKFISDDAGYAVFQNSSGQLELRVPPPVASVTSGGTTTEYTTFADAVRAWSGAANGATLKLLSDVTTADTISVSGTRTLDLNGHGIRMTGSDRVINVGSASLTLNDSAPNAQHKYTIQNPKSNGAGLAVVDDANGTQTFTGGYITGGDTNDRGGGVVVNGGSLTMNGGTVIGNNAANHGGGVALKEQGGTFNMNGGALIGNTGKYGGGLTMINASRGTVNGGKIQYNCTSKNGGGIHTDGAGYRASLTVTGGTIANNYCDGETVSGGGVLVSGMTFNLSGSVEIKDNLRKSGADNLCLVAGKTVIVADTLSNSTPIGVTMKTPGVFTNTASDKVSFNDAAKFVSDDAGYAVSQNSSNQLELVPVVTFDANGGEGTMAEQTVSHDTAVVLTPNAFTRADYTFAGWNTQADGTGTPYADGASVTLTAPLTLYAQWTSKPLYTVSGTVKQKNTPTDNPLSGVTLQLVQGEKKIAVTATNTAGEFSFSAPDGIYNIVAVKDGKTKTELVTLNANQQVNITMPAGNVNSTLTVTGSEIKNVMVGGLDELAMTDSEPGKTVTVTMTVEEKEDAANKSDIQEIAAANQSLDCLEIKIEKTVDSGAAEDVTDTGNKVLEIVVPYRFTGKKDVEVYRYHGSVEKLKKEDSKADGTYQTDENNGLIYIYASKFSTYAIGYTQLYTVACPINYGSYTGTVTVSLLDASDNVVASHAIDVNNGSGTYSFAGVPEGEYKLRAVWTEGEKETTLNGSLNVQ